MNLCRGGCCLTRNSNPVPVTWIEVAVPKPDLTHEQKLLSSQTQRTLLVSLSIAWTAVKPNEESWGTACEALQENKGIARKGGTPPRVPWVILVQVWPPGADAIHHSSRGRGRMLSPREKLLSDKKIEKESQVLELTLFPFPFWPESWTRIQMSVFRVTRCVLHPKLLTFRGL